MGIVRGVFLSTSNKNRTMITDTILSLIYYFVYSIVFLISSFGDVAVSPSITAGIESMASYAVSLSDIFPVGTIFSIMAFVIIFDTALLTYRLIRWGYQKVPGIN